MVAELGGTLLRIGLTTKLVAAVAALALALAAFLVLYVGPATAGTFAARTQELLQQGVQAMQQQAHELTRQGHDVLVDVIAHTTDARHRTLEDLPLALYADVESLRAAIRAEDARRGERLRANTAVLARETQARAEARIDAELLRLEHEQRRLAASFASELRTVHLALCFAFVAVAVAILVLGLHHVIVRPVARLRAATRRVAGGELGVAVAPSAGDEIGQLTADFGAMLAQLQASRAALARLNANLEHEVAQKTEHLEQALRDLQQSHRELAQAERLAAIGNLAGGIAHEFNNLIGGIRGCAEELARDERDADRAATFGVIRRAADRAAAITGQLLRFARHAVREPAELDLAAVVRDALALQEPEARRRGVEVAADLPPGLCVRGDADALHQVAVNLLTNALQAMPHGGRLAVRAARRGGEAVLEVADTGTGIAPDDLGRIFEPFFTSRGDDADPHQRGTGLGLAVSYGIVQAHGGTIEVASEPGRGSTFRVRLPLAVPERTA